MMKSQEGKVKESVADPKQVKALEAKIAAIQKGIILKFHRMCC